jgi:hypothetical protein
MTETLALVLVVLVNSAAAVAVGVVATKWLRGWLFGVVTGIACEVMRILVAMAIVNPLHGIHSDTLGWLVNLRLYNIPILVGLGLMVGTASSKQAQLKQTTCPHCKAAISVNMAVIQAKAAQAGGGSSQEYKEPCPTCKTELTYDLNTGDVVQPMS